MNLSDDLQKLEQLRSSGALSEDEFMQAKAKLLSPPDDSMGVLSDKGQDSLGRAANRYVSFQMIMAAIGIILFLFILFKVILPNFSGMPSFSGRSFP